MLDFLVPNAIAADEAATATQGFGAAGLEGLLFPVALIVIFYFLLIRPQQKRNKEHKELVAGSKKGDEVVTNGGLLGKITDVDDSFITLEIGANMSVQVMKSSISSVMPKGTYAAAGKAKK